MGAKNGNAGGVGATTDRNQGKSGADVVVGLATGDVLVGGAGDDHLSGLGGNDILVGGQGGDILSGGGGKDAVRAGNGDDRAVYSLSENTGSDFYDGGHGSDVLQLNLTPAEFFELRQELIDIQRWIAAGGDGPGKSDARGHGYETSFGLTFRNFESVEFQVEGYGSVDPANTPPEAVADAVAGSEDAPLLLTAADLLTNDSDADGDDLTIVAVEAEARDGDGNIVGSVVLNGDGSITFTPLANWSGTATFSYTVDDGNGENVAGMGIDVRSASVEVSVAAVADAPEISVAAAAGDEDTSIVLDLSAVLVDTDGSESLAITLSGVPVGALLSAGTDNGDGSWSLDAGDLEGLTITPPTDNGDDIELTLTATTTEAENGDQATSTASFTVTVDAVADVPGIATANAGGDEDTAIALDLGAALADTDGSENLAIALSGVPAGAILSAGTDNGDGSWSLGVAELEGLTITPPANSGDDLELTLTATATEAENSDQGTSMESFTVTVNAVADDPQVGVTAAGGDEDTAIDLDLSAALADTDGSENLAIALSGVPVGATLSAGTDNGDGSWSLGVAELEGLTITPLGDSAEDFTLTLTATATEDENSDQASSQQTFDVTVSAVADAPSVDVQDTAGDQDTAITLDIAAALTDTDGSESLSITIAGVPAGATLSAGSDDGDGNWTLSSADLAGLTITPPADSADDFTLAVTATATESENGDQESVNSTINVTVSEVASGAINLSELNGDNGFVINGINGNDASGTSVGAAGDVNGDGFEDIIIGALQVDGQTGQSYVVFGGDHLGSLDALDGIVDGSIDLNEITSGDGSHGFSLDGIDPVDHSGLSVSGAGDVNGDGIADFIIGAAFATPEGQYRAGESYVVFGNDSGFGAGLDLSSLDGSSGFTINGVDANDTSGISVSSAGDVNGDGFDDVIIGAQGAGNPLFHGEAYVVFGEASCHGGSLDLSSLDGDNGFVINAIDAGDEMGLSVSSAGDVNGDGFDDVIIGGLGGDPNGQSEAGESYLLFGGSGVGFGGSFDLSSLDGSNGFVLNGISAGDDSGRALSSAGDVNGDGYDDLVIGARSADPNGRTSAGENYVVFGGSHLDALDGNADGTIDLHDITVGDGSHGFAVTGINDGDSSGLAVSSAGDVNGDGIDDIIVGAFLADQPGAIDAGQSYVIYGSASGFEANLDLSSLDDSNGFVINGIDAGDISGRSVSSAGDVDGDGFADLIIGAPQADPGGAGGAGESYVVFGGNFTDAVSHEGTAGADALTGTDGDDAFIAGHGDDTLIGGDGNDRLVGGAGNDILRGGEGDDIAEFSGRMADYELTSSGTGIRVTDLDPVRDGNDGSDQLYGVETLRFEDGDIAVSMSNGEFQVNTSTAGNQKFPSVAALSDGGYVVTWNSLGQDGSGQGIYGQVYDASGNTVGSEFQVNTYTTGDQQKLQPASYVAALSDGGFVVTWESQGQDGDGYGVYAQRYDSSGNAAGDEFQVNTYATNDQKYPSVAALSDGGFVVAWTSDGQDGSGHGIYAQRYDASGNAEGSEFQVNSNAAIKQEVPSVAKLLDGGFVVTWHSWPDQDGSLYAVHGQRYDADGTAIGGEFLVNTHTASSQVNSFVAALSDGGFVVTWASYKQDGSLYGIYGQRYKEDGTKDGDEFQINTHTALNQDYPYVAALPDGGFVVTWMSEQEYGGGNNVYAQIYDSSGNAVGSEFQINTYTSGNQVTSTVAVLSDGGFVVAWGSQGQDGSGMGIFAQRFDADGNPVGPVTFTGTSGDDTINGGSGSETIVGGAGDDTISGGPGDDVAEFAGRMADYTIGQVGTGVEVSDTDPVRDGNDGTDQLDGVETLSFADGELTLSMAGGEIQVNTYTAGNQLTPRVAGLSDGGSIVTWQSAGQDGSGLGVYAQRFDAAGNPVGPEFLVNETTSQEQQAPDVTALADGGFVIAWQSGTSLSDDIFGQRYDASGEAVGSEFRINTYTSGDQDLGSLVGLCEGGFVVVWISMGQDGSNWGVYGQRYDASGETAGSEFQINTFTTGEQVGAKVAALADGGFVVTWSSPGQDGDQRGVYGQRYDGNGNKDGSEFQVNTTTAGDQVPGTVAALSDGGFVVAWYASGQDGSGWGIFGQRFDASGTAAGSEFQVNTYTSGDQLNPKVAGLADGGFVVTWQSNGQDGSSWGIFGQRFDADGNEDGAEFQVNTFTAGNQGAAWVDGLADGGFMVTWYSTGQDGSGDGVYAQRFDPEGNPLGPLTITGGDGDDTITAGSGSETLIGGDGNDTLTGGSTGQDLLAGGDVLIGGTGDDVLAIDGAVAGLDGGAGNDTLRLAGSGQTLDLTGHGGDEVSGIENVDLGGQGNTLTLTMADVLDISDTTDQLLVDGGADDSVSAPGEGWTNQGTTVVEGNTYTIYTNGSASLLVDTDIGNQIVN